jgi:hypothetical protein
LRINIAESWNEHTVNQITERVKKGNMIDFFTYNEHLQNQVARLIKSGCPTAHLFFEMNYKELK